MYLSLRGKKHFYLVRNFYDKFLCKIANLILSVIKLMMCYNFLFPDGKKKKKKKTKSDFVHGKTETESVTMATNFDTLATKMESLATEDTEELEELLRLKKLELENLEREGK